MKSWTYKEIKENLKSKKWKIISFEPAKYHEEYATDYIILDENNKTHGFHLQKDSLKDYCKIEENKN